MSWFERWRSIDARIDGVLQTADFAVQAAQVSSGDPYGNAVRIIRHCQSIAKELTDFESQFASSLPQLALEELARLKTDDRVLFDRDLNNFGAMESCVASLASFRATFKYHIHGAGEVAKRHTERAFIHLQQTIVTDSGARTRWSEAYGAGETACETLGAVHLLAHGIWSFKAHGVGARTDLVCREQMLDVGMVERSADSLVLTEWKKVADPKKVEAVATAAREQMSLYGRGLLSSIELADQRYVVLVSRDRLSQLADVVVDGVRYRHVNVAVEPSVPSRAT